jgi:hypothetical protein
MMKAARFTSEADALAFAKMHAFNGLNVTITPPNAIGADTVVHWCNDDDSPMTAREYLRRLHLDWVNNYGSASTFSEHHELSTPNQAFELLKLARDVFNADHPEP